MAYIRSAKLNGYFNKIITGEYMGDINEVHKKVSNQYTNWVYPLPEPDIAKVIAEKGYHDLTDPALFRRVIFPTPIEPEDLEILIAGCGANQAAYYAYKNPNCHVTGIDISENSLAHQKYLKDKHNLVNLELHNCTLEDAPKRFNKKFDYIVSTGVLHHLPDPDAGLLALKEMLAPHGVMSIMLYGKYMRAGVYMMQELFRLAKLEQNEAGVSVVKATLNSLRPTHSARHYADNASDIHYDAGIVDTFLHRSDRAYSVPEVLAFAEKAGLSFRGWLDKSIYSADLILPYNHPLRPHILELPEEEQWAAMELLTQGIGCHRFLLCHKDVKPETYIPNFSGKAWLKYIPALRPPVQVIKTLQQANGGPAQVKRAHCVFDVQKHEVPLLEAIDGKRTVQEIIDMYPADNTKAPAVLEIARSFFSRMAKFDHLQFNLKPNKK